MNLALRTLAPRFALAAAAAAMTLAGAASAQAGMLTTVTVKNNTAYPMTFRSPSGQILGTVSPNPPGVAPINGGTSIFTVNSTYSNIASIHFYFENGSRGCKFDTSYTTSGGYTKAATSSGSTYVSCTATLTSFNSITHDYTITFTLN
ncbi:hypothetical protein [Azospirillum sp.]|uniref:hypothetical protein n=1 Tax=Azospirillum sp. TaxID=34012 RepID=UPI002D7456E8|nr:hypothetical protein [Azospirillum sp.]HYD71066.1 hypothetical protein [Azospirillum sp.]